jgi:hypothetical protein
MKKQSFQSQVTNPPSDGEKRGPFWKKAKRPLPIHMKNKPNDRAYCGVVTHFWHPLYKEWAEYRHVKHTILWDEVTCGNCKKGLKKALPELAALMAEEAK